jgi:predicted amidophosphoribosyltransferase
MDARSLRRRGFNQAERVAVELGERWSLPVVADAVVKPRPTRPQSLAAHDERLSNVRGAFRPGPGSVAGRDAILVDDLVTTGATAAAVAAILGARGAASVTVASLGRS